MNIDLGDYVITSDTLQFILNEKKVYGENSKHVGQSYLIPVGYYGKIPQLVDALMTRCALNLEQCSSLQALTTGLRHCTSTIVDRLQGLKL